MYNDINIQKHHTSPKNLVVPWYFLVQNTIYNSPQYYILPFVKKITLKYFKKKKSTYGNIILHRYYIKEYTWMHVHNT